MQNDILRGMLGVRRVDRISNVREGVNEFVSENILRWNGYVIV